MARATASPADHDHISPFETAARDLPTVHLSDDSADVAPRSSRDSSRHRSGWASKLSKLSCFEVHDSSATGTVKPTAYCHNDRQAHLETITSVDSGGAAPTTKQRQRRLNLCSCWGGQQLQSKHTSCKSVEPQSTPKVQKFSSFGSGIHSVVEWFDARSVFSHEIHTMLSSMKQQPTLNQGQTEQQATWIPDTPLLFADQELRFVPVPKVTGYAGYWEVDYALSTPYPLPIHDLINASKLVRKVHKSISVLEIQETDDQLTLEGTPAFMPPGFPVKYCETYHKTNSNPSSWTPRRDLKLGSCSGRMYMTDTGMLVLRSESRPMFRNNVDYIVEDYIQLEADGQIIKDRMCCYEVATGKRAEQVQVGRLRPRQP